MQLLVSPSTIDEVRHSLAADIIDVKKASEGSLGANFPWIIREIKLLSDKPLSAAIGDFDYKPGGAALAAYGAACAGADYVKMGLAFQGHEKARDVIQAVVKAVKDEFPKKYVEVTNPVSAAREALKALAIRRMALLTPYIDEVNLVVEKHFSDDGFQVVEKASFKVTNEYETRRISPESIFRAAVEIGQGDVDGVFISCTALRCSSIIESLEAEIGKPVVTSNQATAWHCLKLGGCTQAVNGFGRLLRI